MFIFNLFDLKRTNLVCFFKFQLEFISIKLISIKKIQSKIIEKRERQRQQEYLNNKKNGMEFFELINFNFVCLMN